MEISRIFVTGTRVSGKLIWRIIHALEEGVSVYVAPHIASDVRLMRNKGHDLVGFIFIHDTHHAIAVVKIAASVARVIAKVVPKSIALPLIFTFFQI